VKPRQRNTGLLAMAAAAVIFITPFVYIFLMAAKDKKEASRLLFSWPSEWHLWAN
jgi:raffinose/stachyose/melibiose transport system permease protein